jgi:hypothetical protein
MTTTLTVMWKERHPDCQLVEVIGESDKALKIKNVDSKRQAWIPKAGLRQYSPPKGCKRLTDKTEKVVADWFRAKCSLDQMAALGFAE